MKTWTEHTLIDSLRRVFAAIVVALPSSLSAMERAFRSRSHPARANLLLAGCLIIGLPGCSYITIQNPSKNETYITNPYDIRVEHEGCGSVERETFHAWLDKGTKGQKDITAAFSHANGLWTAENYSFPFGDHTLTAIAGISKAGVCAIVRETDVRNFQVGEFERFENYAIEMSPPTLTLVYRVPSGTYMKKIDSGKTATLYPGGSSIRVTYALRNKTEKNYRFNVCLFYDNRCRATQLVEFRGPTTVNVSQTVTLEPADSRRLTVEATDILYEPIGNDVRPTYFSSIVSVRRACLQGQKCCEPQPDGSCGLCVNTSGFCPPK